MAGGDDLYDSLRMELRRGSLTLGVLARLREERYGYTLRQALAADGLEMEESTLYPLLRRLEGQGLLASEWRIEDGPPRRYYRLNQAGEQLYTQLTASWRGLAATMEGLLEEGSGQ